MEKVDYKKLYKDLYLPKTSPVRVEVPAMNFITVDGAGSPQGEEYQEAIGILYALTFTIKMSKMSGQVPEGYFEYVVPPLEGLWSVKDGEPFDLNRKEHWTWTSMIRQPEFVTPEVFAWAAGECRRKKPGIDVSKARFGPFAEGLCVQILHIGPYSEEPASLAKIDDFIRANHLQADMSGARCHHEIYLGDPRKTAPEKQKTVLRIPVKIL